MKTFSVSVGTTPVMLKNTSGVSLVVVSGRCYAGHDESVTAATGFPVCGEPLWVPAGTTYVVADDTADLRVLSH